MPASSSEHSPQLSDIQARLGGTETAPSPPLPTAVGHTEAPPPPSGPEPPRESWLTAVKAATLSRGQLLARAFLGIENRDSVWQIFNPLVEALQKQEVLSPSAKKQRYPLPAVEVGQSPTSPSSVAYFIKNYSEGKPPLLRQMIKDAQGKDSHEALFLLNDEAGFAYVFVGKVSPEGKLLPLPKKAQKDSYVQGFYAIEELKKMLAGSDPNYLAADQDLLQGKLTVAEYHTAVAAELSQKFNKPMTLSDYWKKENRPAHLRFDEALVDQKVRQSLTAKVKESLIETAARETQPKSLKIDLGAQTDRGKVRPINEDSFVAAAKGQPLKLSLAHSKKVAEAYSLAKQGSVDATLLGEWGRSEHRAALAAVNGEKIMSAGVGGLSIVADGLGGGELGEYASERAVEFVLAELARVTNWEKLSADKIRQTIVEAIKAVNTDLFEYNTKNNLGVNFGSTFALTLLVGRRLYHAHVGDSRVYLYGEEPPWLNRLTNDHLMGGLLYRSLGGHPEVEVDVAGPIEVNTDVKILVCSDGLWGMIRGAEIAKILGQKKPSQEITRELIETANANGGKDNITALVADLKVS